MTTSSFMMQSGSKHVSRWGMPLYLEWNVTKELPSSGLTSNIYTILLSHSLHSPEMTNSFIFHAISDQLVMSTQSTTDKISGLNEAKKFGE